MKFFKKKTWDDILQLEDNKEKVNEIYKYLSKKCHYGNVLNELNEKEKVLYSVMDFESEINEGGLEQFFYSEASNDLETTCQSLSLLGVQPMAEILLEATQLFPNSYIPTSQDERVKLLELLLNNGPIFNELDEKYNQLEINLLDYYLDYIK